jgi:hypothetical protein
MADNASETAWEKEAMIEKYGSFSFRCFSVVVMIGFEDLKRRAYDGKV